MAQERLIELGFVPYEQFEDCYTLNDEKHIITEERSDEFDKYEGRIVDGFTTFELAKEYVIENYEVLEQDIHYSSECFIIVENTIDVWEAVTIHEIEVK